jgi:hypothetical protein
LNDYIISFNEFKMNQLDEMAGIFRELNLENQARLLECSQLSRIAENSVKKLFLDRLAITHRDSLNFVAKVKEKKMVKKIGIAVLAAMFLFSAVSVFATDVRVGKYVAGDSRNDLDYDYWILLNSNGTAGLHMPGGAANGTWSYDGDKIYIKITSAQGEMASGRGQTLVFWHADATGTVLFGEDDAWWLQ